MPFYPRMVLVLLAAMMPLSMHLAVYQNGQQDASEEETDSVMPILPSALEDEAQKSTATTNCKKTAPQGIDTQERLAGSFTSSDDVATSVDDGFEPLTSADTMDMPAKDLDPKNLKIFVSKEIVWKPPIKAPEPPPERPQPPLYVPRFEADITMATTSEHGTARLEGRLYVDQIKGMMKYVMQNGDGGYEVKLLLCGQDDGTMYTYKARSSKVAEDCKFYKLKCSDKGLLPTLRVAPTAKLEQENEDVLPQKHKFVERVFKANHWKYTQHIQMSSATMEVISEDWVEVVPEGNVPAKVVRAIRERQSDGDNAKVIYKKSVIFSKVRVLNETHWKEYVIPPKAFTTKEAADKSDTENNDVSTTGADQYQLRGSIDVRARTCSGPHNLNTLRKADAFGRVRKYITNELQILDQLLL